MESDIIEMLIDMTKKNILEWNKMEMGGYYVNYFKDMTTYSFILQTGGREIGLKLKARHSSRYYHIGDYIDAMELNVAILRQCKKKNLENNNEIYNEFKSILDSWSKYD